MASRRRERQFLIITRDEQTGAINVVRISTPSNPQTLAFRLRRGQQVVIELEPDNTKEARRG